MSQRIGRHHRDADILLADARANSFGLESAGVFQLRGNGTLLLTASELHFFMILPEREVRIPLTAITGTEIVRKHLGKTVGRELLKVHFTAGGGQPDAIAWYLRDPRAWLTRVDELRA
jgi:hypothetical protein